MLHALITGTLHAIPWPGAARAARRSLPRICAIAPTRKAASLPSRRRPGAEHLRLKDGDVLSLQGEAQLVTYIVKDGATLPAVEIVTAHVLALHQPKPAKQARERERELQHSCER